VLREFTRGLGGNQVLAKTSRQPQWRSVSYVIKIASALGGLCASGGLGHGSLYRPIAFSLSTGVGPELKVERARNSDTDFASECNRQQESAACLPHTNLGGRTWHEYY
jgi:hypothetical protein